MSEFAAAKRGDLVAVVEVHSDFVIGKGSQEWTTVELGIVTSITRQGEVKAYRTSWGSDYAPRQPITRLRFLVVPASKVNVEAAYEAGRQHTYEGHPNQPKPFDSVDEAREFVRQFAREEITQ